MSESNPISNTHWYASLISKSIISLNFSSHYILAISISLHRLHIFYMWAKKNILIQQSLLP